MRLQDLRHEPRRVRYPDGSYVKAGRLEPGKIARGYTEVIPDLIFGVISPNDEAEEASGYGSRIAQLVAMPPQRGSKAADCRALRRSESRPVAILIASNICGFLSKP